MTEDLHIEPVQRFRILGAEWSSNDVRLQAALARVYQDGSSAGRLHCLCTRGGVEMYVARYQHGLVVKRLPHTGAKHHASCPSYEPEVAESGLGELVGDAVVEVEPGRVDVRVDFSLSRTDRKAAISAVQSEIGTVKKEGRGMSLRALMQLLIHRAGFDRWSPAMRGKRSQWVFHKYVMEAATELFAKGSALSDRLYVPEQFNESTHQEAARRRREKLSILRPRDGIHPFALILGEFKKTDVFAGHRRVWIRHMPDAPLIVREATWHRIEKKFAQCFEAIHADVALKLKLVLCAVVSARRDHTYEIEAAGVIMTTIDWIPVEGAHEILLLEYLIRTERRFIKPMRFDAGSDRVFASALLIDAGTTPIPIFSMGPFMPEKHLKQVRSKISGAGDRVLVWNANIGDSLLTSSDLSRTDNSSGTQEL